MTIGYIVSRVRNTIKAVKNDAFITDRFLYSLVVKYAKAFIRRQDTLNQLLKYSTLFKTLPCIDLIESNAVEACCGISADYTIKRTKQELPGVMEAAFGPILRFVSSVDGSLEVYPTTPSTYRSLKKSSGYKYNKAYYYWFLNNYLYFPNLPWDQVKLDGVFEGDLSVFSCDTKSCVIRQDQTSAIPDFLLAEIEQQVLQELGITYQLPEDSKNDKMAQTR